MIKDRDFDIIATDKQVNTMKRTMDILLRDLQSNMSSLKLMKKFYTFLDEQIADNFQHNVCTRGCYHCCNVPVAVSGIEALYIQETTKHKVTDWSHQEIDHDKSYDYCIFLKNGECSIYDARPAACRVFLTFDSVDFCKDEAMHWILSLNGRGDGGFEWANTMYYILASDLSSREDLMVMKEIRDYFK